jgi:hypothetical protein
MGHCESPFGEDSTVKYPLRPPAASLDFQLSDKLFRSGLVSPTGLVVAKGDHGWLHVSLQSVPWLP